MRLDDERGSRNVEDRRGQGGGGGGLPLQMILNLLMRSRFGWVIALLLAGSQFLGFNVLGLAGGGGGSRAPVQESAAEKALYEFASKTLSTTERIWGEYFRSQGQRYREPKMVIYRGGTGTACGHGQAVMGPFYCPADDTIYLDLSFYDDMQRKLKAGGDFAFAYVIAHEVGHHVQNMLGISRRTQNAQRSASKNEANRISVAVELQADCFAGVWAHHVQQENRLEQGDIEEAFRAAQAVGDDYLQKQSHGHITPENFTHGTSAQRLQWFRTGLRSGQPRDCNTVAF